MKEHHVIPGSREYTKLRDGIVTASQMSRILTPAKGDFAKGHRSYAYEIIGDTLRGGPNRFGYNKRSDYQSREMEYGEFMEREAREWLRLRTRLAVRQAGFCVSDCGRYGCTPDALIDPDGGAEIKVPSLETHLGWLDTLLGTGEIPDDHKAQVHGSLIVTGRAFWYFLSYCPAPNVRQLLVKVTPNAYTDKLRIALERFMPIIDEVRSKTLVAPLPDHDGKILDDDVIIPKANPQDGYF